VLSNVATPFRFFLFPGQQDWDTAQAVCRLNGGDLPTLKSERLDRGLRLALNNVDDDITSIWLGASNKRHTVRFC